MQEDPMVAKDKIIAYEILNRLLEDPKETEAYQLGLIDEFGTIIKDPVTVEELEAMTLLDVLVVKIRELLGPKISFLRKYIYIQNYDDNVIESIILRNKHKAETGIIKRVERELRKDIERDQV